MQGKEIKLLKFMKRTDSFIIPVYQRNYDWKTDNCKQLYNDLLKIVKKDRPSHFFGNIVYVQAPDPIYEKSLIIDGQQRLTTMSLLFLAMYNRLKEGSLVSENKLLQKNIYNEYLSNPDQPDEARLKLKPAKNDQLAYRKFFEDDTSEHIEDSNLTKNYEFFYDRLGNMDEDGITIDDLFKAICRIEIIAILLEGADNAQLIFESLNSTGLALKEGDKIRNFILMDLDEERQHKYYQNYWTKIETCTNYDVSSFVRDYLTIKQGATPKIDDVYKKFKEYVFEEEKEIPDILDEMVTYAKRYEILLKGVKCVTDKEKKEYRSLNGCINRLNRLETTTTRPFFLEVLRLWDEGILTSEEVTEIFKTTENYLFRRIICDLPSNSLNKIFASLHNEIYRYQGNTDKYLGKFKYALLTKRDRARFPGDEEFVEAFSNKSVYRMPSKNSVYLLERLENFGAGEEDKDIYRHCDDGTYSIEHIMPQRLTPVWQKDLGKGYAKVHETWLHRIANLTLTAYNSSYSNKPFIVKKTCEHGFKTSGIRLNTYIASFDKWNRKSLEERDRILKEEALKIWERPKININLSDRPLFESSSLDEEENFFVGRTITEFTLRKKNYKIDSWTDMYQQVIQILFTEHRSTIKRLASSQKGVFASQFTKKRPKEGNGYREIGGGVYISINNSTERKLRILKELFKECEESPSDLIFYLRAVEGADESAE